MSYMKLSVSSVVLMAALLHGAYADEAPGGRELNDAMAERAELMVNSHQAKERIAQAWADKSLTSPEIEKLRQRYQELRFEMIAVREKLKTEVQKLPEIQEQQRRIEAMAAREKQLAEKIETLKKR
jgi:chromosome segregation ATPase